MWGLNRSLNEPGMSLLFFPYRPAFLLAWMPQFILAILCWGLLNAALAAPKSDLDDLRTRITRLQQDLESAEESKADATDALKVSEQAISQSNRKLYELERERAATDAVLARITEQSGKAQAAIETQQNLLAKLIYQQYLTGGEDYLKLLLNQQDPNQIARHLHYYSYISRARADLIRDLKGNLAQLQTLTQQAQEKNSELDRIKSERISHKRQLEQEQNQRRTLLSQLSQKIHNQRREISNLQRNEKRLTKLVEQLAKIVAPKSPRKPPRQRELPVNTNVPDDSRADTAFRRLKGQLSLPVRGELVSHFGSPREDGGALWKGIFIRARSGAEVKAVASGRVVFADWLRGFGNLLILDHGGGYMSLYGNNETLYKQVGESIRAGDTVAAVGNSGGNPDSGLYFELRFQSKPFDPLSWVK